CSAPFASLINPRHHIAAPMRCKRAGDFVRSFGVVGRLCQRQPNNYTATWLADESPASDCLLRPLRTFSQRRSCSGISVTLQMGSTMAARPPMATDPVNAWVNENETPMWRRIWLVLNAMSCMNGSLSNDYILMRIILN